MTQPSTDVREAVVCVNGNGVITEINDPTGLLGYNDAAIGQPLVDLLIPEGMRERHLAGFQLFVASGDGEPLKGKPVNLPIVRSDGTTFRARVVMSAEQRSHDRVIVARISVVG